MVTELDAKVIDLAERAKQKKPLRVKITVLEVENGTLVVDKRLGNPPLTPDGSRFIWMVPEEVIAETEKEWPIIWPYYE